MRLNAVFLVLIFTIFFKGSFTFAQISKQWETRYTDVGFLDELSHDIIMDNQGNSFVLGSTGKDALITKYDQHGTLVWSFQAGRKVFVEHPYDHGRDFKIDSDGNLYVLLRGSKGVNQYGFGLSLLKLNPSGQQVWQTYMEGAYERGKISLAVHTDGSSFILNRQNYTDISLTKVSSSGVVSWSKIFTSTVESFVQQVSIINNSIVAWHYSGYQTYDRKSYLHVLSLDGDMIWENSYQYDMRGTHIRGVQFHANELIVGYYVENMNTAFHRIIRYSIVDGSIIHSFSLQTDTIFSTDEPISILYVGEDSHLYVMGEDELLVKKYTLLGEFVWSYEYAPEISARYEVIDFVINKSTSSANVFLETTDLPEGTKSYSVVNFKPNKTTALVAKVAIIYSSSQPIAMAESDAHILIAGSFDNGIFKKDLQVSKFTKTNQRVWEASFTPSNSLQHEATCMAIDDHGNIFVGGKLGVDTYNNAFGVIKYTPSGEITWIKKFAPENKYGIDFDETKVLSIATTTEGDIVLTGGIQLGDQFSTMNEPPVEMYTVKLNTNGDILWTSKTSSQTGDYLTGLQIALDDQQNIYVLGSNHNTSNPERRQMVLVKYDVNGIQQWEKRFGLYSSYTSTATRAPDTDMPRMKIVNNAVYVASDGFVKPLNGNYYPVAELRKFELDGTETMLKQIPCGNCQLIRIRDLQMDALGNILLLHSNQFTQTTLSKFSATGQLVWSKDWIAASGTKFTVNASIAFDLSNNIYMVRASSTELNYTKINANGVELWEKTEILSGLHNNYGQPAKVFVTKDNAPIFFSTNKNAQGSRYYFISERDKNTGNVTFSETFDETFDIYGYLPYYSPGDQLVSVINPINTFDFYITGVIQDKVASSETIVTLKYAVSPVVPAPEPFTAIALSSSKIKLSLATAPNDIQRIVYGSTDGIQFEQLAQIQSSEFVHTGLNDDQTYYYRIVDTNGENFSVFSPIVEAQTLKLPAIIGSDPIAITMQQEFSIPLSALQVENAPNYPVGYSLIILDGDHYEFTESKIIPNADFVGDLVINVRIASAEDTSPIYQLPVKVLLPAPQPFSATALSSSKIKLSLATAPASIQRIIYGSTDGIQFEQLAQTQSSEFVHTGLTVDQTYYYRMVDTDGENFSVLSPIVEAQTLKLPAIIGSDPIVITMQQEYSIPLSALQVENAPNYPVGYSLIILNGDHYEFTESKIIPNADFVGDLVINVRIASAEDTSPVYQLPVKVLLPAPQLFSATTLSSSKIKLSLTTAPASIQRIIYGSTNGIQFEQLAQTQSSEYVHTSLTAGQTYYYRMVDTDGKNFSVLSPIVEAQTLKLPAIIGSDPIAITMQQEYSIPLSALQVENAPNYPVGYSLIILNGDHYEFTESKIIPNADFVGDLVINVRIASAEDTSPVYQLPVKVLLPAPQLFSATTLSSSKIRLSLPTAPASIQRIIYGSTDGIQFEQLTQTQYSEYVHTSLTADQTYYYRMVDTDGKNFSVLSPIVEAQTLKLPAIIGSDPIAIIKQQEFSIPLSALQVENAPNYPVGYSLIILNGDHYEFTESKIIPNADFVGDLVINVRIASAEDTSPIFHFPVKVQLVTSIEMEELQLWSIYPNPVKDMLSISSDQYSGSAIITIFDNLGRMVYSGLYSNGLNSAKFEVDFKVLTSGSYIVTIEGNGIKESRYRVTKF